jgi:hypothetical protein
MMVMLTYSPSKVAPEGGLPWSDADAADLTTFMNSTTGQRFTRILKDIEAQTNAQAVIDKKDIVYNSGTAFGNRCMLAHVFALSATTPQPNQEDEYELLRHGSGLEELEQMMAQQHQQ